MFKRINRLNKKKDIENVFKNGRASYNKIIGVKTVNNELEQTRFAVIISKKVSKSAVNRNKIKRQIREIIKMQLKRIKTNKDCIIITLPPILEKKYPEIEESINKHFDKLHLYNNTLN